MRIYGSLPQGELGQKQKNGETNTRIFAEYDFQIFTDFLKDGKDGRGTTKNGVICQMKQKGRRKGKAVEVCQREEKKKGGFPLFESKAV